MVSLPYTMDARRPDRQEVGEPPERRLLDPDAVESTGPVGSTRMTTFETPPPRARTVTSRPSGTRPVSRR